LELVADDRVAALLELDPAGLLAAQAEPGRSEAVAGIGGLDAAVGQAEVQQPALLGDAVAEQ
jgi:hypothetical protein